jgi:Helix-turn-helix domain
VTALKFPESLDRRAIRSENSEAITSLRLVGVDCDGSAVARWPARPCTFPELLTPTEAAQYLRLDELGTHTPTTAIRTLNYWRDRKELKGTKYARHVWFRKSELDRFLANKTES